MKVWVPALMLALSWPNPAAASGQQVIGAGPRSIAMGGTGAADADPADATYENPALLSLARARSLQIGLVGALFDLRARGAGIAGPVGYAPLRATDIALVVPLPFGGVLKDRVAIGLSFVTPLDVVVRGRILYPEQPQFLLADRVQSVAVEAALGADLGHGLRLGAGISALAALKGSVLVQTDASGRIGTEVQDTLVATYAPLAGASWDFDDGAYRVGLTVRGQLVGRFDVVITADNLGGLTIPPLNISGVAQYDPWQVAAEIARVKGPWRAAIGASYEHWQAYPGPLEATVRCEDAPPGASCSAPAPPAVDYHAVVSPRLGVERLLPLSRRSLLALRAGYAFEPSPAPEQTGASNDFDCHRSILSAGFGVALGGAFDRAPVGFDGFFQLQVLHPRSHEKSAADGAPEDGTVDTGGLIAAAGIAATARF